VQNEEALVKRAKERDEAAFSQIYDEHFNRIYRYCVLRISDEMEAEDMAQQVFLQALQNIGSYKWTGAPFSAWLFRIAHNQVVDYHRKHSKQLTSPLDELPELREPEDESNPRDIYELKMDIVELNTALNRLTALQREVIALRFTSEMPIAEVAKVMHKTEGAVKALQHSAIASLRKAMAGA